MIISMHPALPFFTVALLALFLSKSVRNFFSVIVPAVSFLCFTKIQTTPALSEPVRLFGYDAFLYRVDALSTLFVLIFLVFAFLANLYALHSSHKYVTIGANLYIGSSLGAVLAGDLATLFIFWELMAVSSAILIWNPNRSSSGGALFRYLLVHFVGGLFFFAGLVLQYIESGNLFFDPLFLSTLSGKLIFLGFAINAAIPPLHAWMADAYPEGTPEGSVYLSCFTSKTAIFVLARGFAGEPWLIYLGAIAAVYGVVFALMENDMRRLLSYHIICQVGYMICGIGIGTELGINAGTGHAVGNILFKGLLFMATGAIIHVTGFSKLSDLGNLAKKYKLLLFFYMVGGLAISGMPLLNGYVTKSLLVKAAAYEHMAWLELTLLTVAVGTFLSITCKLAYFAFWGDKQEPTEIKNTIPWNMNAAMAGSAILCFVFGIFPESLYYFLPFSEHSHVYSAEHVVHTLQLLAGTWLGFLLMRPNLHTKDSLTLDIDWGYRRGGQGFVTMLCAPLKLAQERIQKGFTRLLGSTHENLKHEFQNQNIGSLGSSLTLMAGAILGIGIILALLANS